MKNRIEYKKLKTLCFAIRVILVVNATADRNIQFTLSLGVVCKILLLARALGLNAEQLPGQGRDDRISCIQT